MLILFVGIICLFFFFVVVLLCLFVVFFFFFFIPSDVLNVCIVVVSSNIWSVTSLRSVAHRCGMLCEYMKRISHASVLCRVSAPCEYTICVHQTNSPCEYIK
jgi:hypothetical protein